MKSRSGLAALVLLAALPAWPQAGGTEESANKKLVLDFVRVVFEAQNAQAAADYLTEGYLQHNPLVATGRAGFIKYFGAKWKAPRPVEKELRERPEAVVADGNLVTLMWRLKRPEPKNNAKTYEAFWFDMFRVEDGRIVEHWDNATK